MYRLQLRFGPNYILSILSALRVCRELGGEGKMNIFFCKTEETNFSTLLFEKFSGLLN